MVLIGDLNLDGKITFEDVLLLYNYVNNVPGYIIPNIFIADINLDGKINFNDVTFLYNVVNNVPGFNIIQETDNSKLVKFNFITNFETNINIKNNNSYNSNFVKNNNFNLLLEHGLYEIILDSRSIIEVKNIKNETQFSLYGNNQKLIFKIPFEMEILEGYIYSDEILIDNRLKTEFDNNKEMFKCKFEVPYIDYFNQEINIYSLNVIDNSNKKIKIVSESLCKFWIFEKDNNNNFIKLNSNNLKSNNNFIFKSLPNDNYGLLSSIFNSSRCIEYINNNQYLSETYNNINRLNIIINITPGELNGYFNFLLNTVNLFEKTNINNKTNTFMIENHEIGHFSHCMYGFNGGTPISEGYADLFALFIYYNTFKKLKCNLGDNADKNSNGIRSYCIDKIYPYDIIENSIHQTGTIFMSCINDVYEYLINNYSNTLIKKFENLIHNLINTNTELKMEFIGENLLEEFYNNFYDNNLENILLLELQNHGLINYDKKYIYELSTELNFTIIKNSYITLYILPTYYDNFEYFYINNFVFAQNTELNIYYLKNKDIFNDYNIVNVESILIKNSSNNDITLNIKNIKLI
jgi:hypothetical protein